MNDLFNKIKKNIDKSMTTVSVKSSTALEINKLKAAIKTFNTSIEQRKNELGGLVYNMYLEGAYDESKFAEIGETIKGLEVQIKEKEAEIEKVKEEENQILAKESGKLVCECGAAIEDEMLFCVECGKKVR
ncbi:MAG: hypothetical protein ACRCWY_03155 [Cellulosilyticaceae bacterium]